MEQMVGQGLGPVQSGCRPHTLNPPHDTISIVSEKGKVTQSWGKGG